MPNLDSIATIINNSLKAGGFKTRKFQAAKYFGIADPVKTIEKEEDSAKETLQYCVIDNEGDSAPVVFDDNYPLVIFHRLMNADYQVDAQDYGPTGTTMQETASMKIIVGGNMGNIQTRQENVMASVAMDFPKEIKSADVSALGMNSLVIEMGSVNSDKYSVWGEHWQGIECDLPTNYFLFSVDYKIINSYNKGCFNLCE